MLSEVGDKLNRGEISSFAEFQQQFKEIELTCLKDFGPNHALTRNITTSCSIAGKRISYLMN